MLFGRVPRPSDPRQPWLQLRFREAIPGPDLSPTRGSSLQITTTHMLSYLLDILFRLLPSTRCFALKRLMLRLKGVQVGNDVRVCSSARLMGRNIQIGDGAWIGHECMIVSTSDAAVIIGPRCDLAPQVSLITGSHHMGDQDRRAGVGTSAPIRIGAGCWICTRVTIIGGVMIGDGSVVAAGSVVIADATPNALYAGVPAKLIKQLP